MLKSFYLITYLGEEVETQEIGFLLLGKDLTITEFSQFTIMIIAWKIQSNILSFTCLCVGQGLVKYWSTLDWFFKHNIIISVWKIRVCESMSVLFDVIYVHNLEISFLLQ